MPAGKAKYVAFTTLHDPKQMPGQKTDVLPWPYVEGLRLDEALHPLAILGVAHYCMLVKSDTRLPLRYGAVIAILLGARVIFHLKAKLAAAPRIPDPA